MKPPHVRVATVKAVPALDSRFDCCTQVLITICAHGNTHEEYVTFFYITSEILLKMVTRFLLHSLASPVTLDDIYGIKSQEGV